MGNILKVEKRQQIQTFTQLQWSDRAISRELGVDRGTVSKYRKAFENPPKVPADPGALEFENPPKVPTDPGHSPPPTQSGQICPHRERIGVKYLQHLSAQRIYQDLVEEHGFTGSYDSVKRYVRKIRKRHKRYCDRLAHLPGREAQVDFGKSSCFVRKNGRYRKVWVFKMTLCCSKHAYEELVEQQDIETFIRCHERAFAWFGGVPEIVTLDNIKSGVIQACLYDPILNRTYLSFSSHWGFASNPCMPFKPEHKGVVERDVGYTKDNALKGRRFESIEEGNAFLRRWNRRWAQTRIHGSTKRQVWKMFCEVERPVLRALATRPFEYFRPGKRKVDVNGFIEVDSRYYAVPPHLVGEWIIIHHNSQWVKVFYKEELVISHRRSPRKGACVRPASCLPAWKHQNQESQERYYLRKARTAGQSLHTLVYRILSTDEPLAIRRVRGMMNLLRTFGPEVSDRAAAEALGRHQTNYRAVRAICEQIDAGTPERKAVLTQEHDLIRPLSEYETVFTNERDN
jgi:transposase/ribosomal protein S19